MITNFQELLTLCTSICFFFYDKFKAEGLFREEKGQVVLNLTEHSRVKTVLGKLRNVIYQCYKAYFPKCPHSANHISHGLFGRYVHDKEFVIKFLQNNSALIFVSPKEDRPMGLALISRKILRAKDINKKEHRSDKLALEEANILYDDIEWSFKKIVSGKYIASGKKQKKFSRVYKYGDFIDFHI